MNIEGGLLAPFFRAQSSLPASLFRVPSPSLFREPPERNLATCEDRGIEVDDGGCEEEDCGRQEDDCSKQEDDCSKQEED